MDGIHDMGGMHGFGSTRSANDGAAYHEAWEGRVFALSTLTDELRLGAGPGGRATREEMEPSFYLRASYYERWLWSVEQRLERAGTIGAGELDGRVEELRSGRAATAGAPDPQGAAAIRESLARGERLPAPGATRFSPGDRVRVRRMRPPGHTRAPRYARGAAGTVERVQGADRLPDLATYGIRCDREPVYAISFTSLELWGEPPEGERPWTVLLDLWESYLEPADA